MSKITLDKNLTSIENSWKFNSKISKNFDSHVIKSVPHYLDIQNYVVSLSEWFLKDKTRIYDLGCSTGETINKIANLKLNNKIELIGIDQSSKMLEIAKKKNNKINNKSLKLIYDKKDLTKIKNLKNNDLILSILTLPFLNFKQRKKLIKIIYKSLNKGGGFIFVDKIRSSNSAFEDIFNQVYFDFKLQKKLNPEQILNKSKLLRSSMNLLSANEINSQLNEIGFKKNDVFFKWFNFIGIIAIK